MAGVSNYVLVETLQQLQRVIGGPADLLGGAEPHCPDDGQGMVIAFNAAFIAVALLFVVAVPLLVCIKMVLARGPRGAKTALVSIEPGLSVTFRR